MTMETKPAVVNVNTASLQTESRNLESADIDVVSTLDLCRIINTADSTISSSVAKCLPEIAKAIDLIAPKVRKGGRVIYIGAGTSGRLGVLDASEIPPTFSAPYSQFLAFQAGGDHALRYAVEGAEDSTELAVKDLTSLSLPSPVLPNANPDSPEPKNGLISHTPPIGPLDTVIGIAASGRTPYVLGGLRWARERGVGTVGVCCVSPSEMRGEVEVKADDDKLVKKGMCEVLIECVVGPEVVTGSTRMKSGSATKMILNMISTGVMIRIGKTHGNLMVDVKSSNLKLIDRARRIFRTVLSLPSTASPASSTVKPSTLNDSQIDSLIASCEGSVKLALVVHRLGCTVEEGKKRLEEAGGVLRVAWESEADSSTNGLVEERIQGQVPPQLHNGDGAKAEEENGEAGKTGTDLVLAIDAGGTKCAAVIASKKRGVLARVECGSCNFVTLGHDLALQTISTAVSRALSSLPAGTLPVEGIPAVPLQERLFERVWIGAAGLDRKGDLDSVRKRLREMFAFGEGDEERLLVTNDAALLAAAVLRGEAKDSNEEKAKSKNGIVLITGTGSIAYSFQISTSSEGRFSVQPGSRSSGWGYLLGDEGSAYSIGREALRRGLRRWDEGGEMTSLDRQIGEYFGVKGKMGEVISAVYAPNWVWGSSKGVKSEGGEEVATPEPKLRIAGLARLVVSEAFKEQEKDEEALDIVRSVVKSLIEHVRPLARGSNAGETVLVMGGGLSQVKEFRGMILDELEKEGIRFERVEVVNDPASVAAEVLNK